MGNQASSQLDGTVRKLEDLRSKPELLKAELRQFVAALPADHQIDVRVDKKLFDIMMNLVTYELKKEGSPDLPVIMQAIQRLLRVRGFYSAIPRCSIVPLLQSLQMRDPVNVLATLNALAVLLDCRCPADKKFDKPVAELAAKQAFYESKGYEVLINRVLVPYGRSPHSQVVAKVADMLALDLVDNATTTRFIGIQKLLQLLTPHLDLLLSLTTHRDLNTRCYSSILLQGYLLHSSLQTTQNLQSKVLEEGHLLYYILFAIDGANLPAAHPYVASWYHKNLTDLARNLLGLLCAGNPGIVEISMQKTIPKPLQLTLDQMGADAASNASFSSRTKGDKETIKNTLWNNFQSGRMKRVNVHPQFVALDTEVREPHVLWTVGTKAELCLGLLKEIQELQDQKLVRKDARWDYEGWEISYPSLERYIRVGGFYLSLLLPALQDKNSSYVLEMDRVHVLLAALFQRSVIEDDGGWKLATIRTMSALYDRFSDQLTKDLEILPYFAWLIDPRHTSPMIRDHILKMLATLLKDANNVRRFVKAGGVAHLLYYISRVLLMPDPLAKAAGQKGKAKIAKKKKVESESDEEEEEQEEHKDDVVAMSGAVAGSNGLLADDDQDTGKQNMLSGLPAPLGVTETASACLALLRLIQQAGPKMRRVMSERDVVATLVRLLMAPAPGVKEEGIRLLLEILDHSAHLVPRLAATGMFSFLVYGLRYGTSPATLDLLGKYHLRQDKSLVPPGESALAPYFPRALADVLKTQGAEAFGQLFESRDGATSTAAVAGSDLIWNPQLRKHLLEVMSRRLGSFRALLTKDPLAEYKFSPPEAIRYPSLESELTMSGVSLRQLNETGGVPELLSKVNIPDPEGLMAELVRALNARRFAGIDLLNILTAQSILMKRMPQLGGVVAYEGWDALYEILLNRVESDFPMIRQSAEIVHVLLSAKVHPQQDEEDTNLSNFLSTGGAGVLAKTLEYFASLKVNNILIQRVLIDLLNGLYDLGVKAPEVVAKDFGSSKKFVRKNVLDFLGRRPALQHPMLSVVACKCCMALALGDKFQHVLLETGAILHLIDMAAFHRGAGLDDINSTGGSTASGSNQQQDGRGMDEEKRVRLAAASVLSLLAGYTTAALKPEPNAPVQRVLTALLTADLVQTLSSPSAFVARVSAHRAQLQPLRKYIDNELMVIKQVGEWPQRQWPFEPLGFSLKQPSSARGRGAQQQQYQSQNGDYADEDGDDQQQEYDDDPQHEDDMPDAYAAAAPQRRVLSSGEKLEQRMSDLGNRAANSMEGAFASLRNKAASAANALTPSKAKQAPAQVRSAASAVAQNPSVQRAGSQVQAGARRVAAAAAPQVAAAQKAAAPVVAAGKQAAVAAAQGVGSAARKVQADAQPIMRQASLQASKAAQAAAPKLAQAQQAAESAAAAAAPKVAAAGAAMGAAAAGAFSAAKKLAKPVTQPSPQPDEEAEEVHEAAEFYANDAGALLSPGVKSPSTQHTPQDAAGASASPHFDEYVDHGAAAAAEHYDDDHEQYPDEAQNYDQQQQHDQQPSHYDQFDEQQQQQEADYAASGAAEEYPAQEEYGHDEAAHAEGQYAEGGHEGGDNGEFAYNGDAYQGSGGDVPTFDEYVSQGPTGPLADEHDYNNGDADHTAGDADEFGFGQHDQQQHDQTYADEEELQEPAGSAVDAQRFSISPSSKVVLSSR